MSAVFGIAGRSGSGKTTLIEAMLPLLAARGLSWLADTLYTNVGITLHTLPAHEWEPELSEQLNKYLPARPPAEADRKS